MTRKQFFIGLLRTAVIRKLTYFKIRNERKQSLPRDDLKVKVQLNMLT